MNKLLKGNYLRLFHNKIFWLSVLAVIVCCLYEINQGIVFLEAGFHMVTLDEHYFYIGPLAALFLSVFIPMFIGVEYSFGTIRNKLTIGHTRDKIYISVFLSCLTGTVIILAAWFAAGLTGIPKLGLWRSGISAISTKFIVTILYSIALTSIFTFFSVLITGRSVSVVFQIVLALVIILSGSMLYNRLCEPEVIRSMEIINGELEVGEPEPNPMYIGGIMRKICVAIINILPSGQAILLLHGDLTNGVPKLIPLQIISSVLITLVFTAAGILLFRKKDLK